MAPSGDWKGDTSAETLHVELCAAIADLAKSVDVAVQQIALRAQCSATIADTTKAEYAAEFLRVAATRLSELEEQDSITTVPLLPTTFLEENRSAVEPYTPSAADQLYAACHWLAASQVQRTRALDEGYREESKIARRVLELQIRLGGLIRG